MVYLAVIVLFLISSTNSVKAISFIDIGLKVNQGTLSSPDIQVAAIENPSDPVVSPLRIAKNGTKYRVALVDVSDPLALKVHIRLPNGITKALRKFVQSAPFPVFDDMSADIRGYESPAGTSFFAEFTINNNSPYTVEFDRIDFRPAYEESAPRSFSIGPNRILKQGGFGSVSYAMQVIQPKAPYGAGYGGSATYSVSVGGSIIDQVTYSWSYTH